MWDRNISTSSAFNPEEKRNEGAPFQVKSDKAEKGNTLEHWAERNNVEREKDE